MIASKWITDWNPNVQSAKDLSVITIQQFYVNLVKTLVTNVIISRLWVFVLIIHWSCLEMYFNWRAFFVTRCCWYFATFWHLVILLFANNIKIVDASTSFSSIFAINTKSYDSSVKISQVIFFFITFQILHLEIQQQGIFLVFLVLFTFQEGKKCNPGFNPWLSVFTKLACFKEISRTCHIYDDVIKNLTTSQRIDLHHANPVVLKIPCAKFHACSCSQTKVKVGWQFCPPPCPLKIEVHKAHLKWVNIVELVNQ